MGKDTFYITTPIYYPSDKLHIGHTYCTVATDTLARYHRLKGEDVMFLTGTDEHGQKIEQKAEAAGITPKEFVDRIVEGPRGVRDLWKLMNISNDRFIRTTDDYHVSAVQKIFRKMYDKGDIYKGTYKGKYCTPCESFWTESQLKDGCCPDCGRPVVDAEEEAYFFRLSKYADRIRDLLVNTDFLQPRSRVNEMVKNFIDPGLEDLCVSRTSFTWGIPVDFDPAHLTKAEGMPVLDRWLITKLNELIEKVEQSYNDYEFHIITHAVNDFCVTTLSSFYLDIVKDRLYCEAADSAERRSAQTALYLTLSTLAKLFAPILAFTCDEIWLAMPHTAEDDARNVVLNDMNKPFTAYALDAETMARWEHIIEVRTAVNGALEEARAAKVIGKSLEADVHLTVPEGDVFLADENPAALADLFIVSKVELTVGGELAVKVENAAGTKCPRCWKHSLTPNAEGLCPRCAEVVRHLPDLL